MGATVKPCCCWCGSYGRHHPRCTRPTSRMYRGGVEAKFLLHRRRRLLAAVRAAIKGRDV